MKPTLFLLGLICFFSDLVFAQYSDSLYIRTNHRDSCVTIYSYVNKRTGIIMYSKRYLDLDSDGKKDYHACYNQISRTDPVSGFMIYTPELANHWYADGRPKRILSIFDGDTLVYTHYNPEGIKTGQEFFWQDIQRLIFFQFVGKWWKLEGDQVKYLDKLPTFFDAAYFEY